MSHHNGDRFWLVRATLVVAAIGVWGLWLPSARAASPRMTMVRPTGGQRGTEVLLTLRGDRLEDFQDLLFYEPGFMLGKVQSATDHEVKVLLRIAPDCAIGQHCLRLRTATGLSELRTFWVGSLPTVAQQAPNNNFAHAQKIEMGVTVDGVIKEETSNYYQVEAKKGQRMTFEVEGLRLAAGPVMFDPLIAVFNAHHTQLAMVDDTALLRQDPTLSLIAPEDGPYFVMIRESAFGGSDQSRYRLHVGDMPRPMAVFPCGGQPGELLKVRFIGDKTGPILATLQLPDQPQEIWPVLAEQDGHLAPSPNWVRVQRMPNVLKESPGNDRKHATVTALEPPLAFNGILEKTGEHDWFRFHAKKDQVLDFHVYARVLRSPLDSVITLYDSAGKKMSLDDDYNSNPDSYLRQSFPADGDYFVEIRDQLDRGGEDYVYRIEVTAPVPQAMVHIPAQALNDSQARQWATVPRDRYLALIQADRTNFEGELTLGHSGSRYAERPEADHVDSAGELTLTCDNLPPGVTMHTLPIRNGQRLWPVVFEAAPDAALAGRLCDLQTHFDVKGPTKVGHYYQSVQLLKAGGGAYLYSVKVNRLAVAVTEEAPFRVELAQPAVPILRFGQMNLKITAKRKSGFDGPIVLEMPYHPPGVDAAPSVTIEKGQTEAVYPINAGGDAAAGEWPIAVRAHANVGANSSDGSDENADDYKGPGIGQVLAASSLVMLKVAPPLMTGEIPVTVAEQGQPAAVLCKLHIQTVFDGSGTLTLMGLPGKCTAAPVQINKDATEAVFKVEVPADAPVGQQSSLFCQFQIAKDGQPMVQKVGGDGVLRIDKPRHAIAATTQPTTQPMAANAAPLKRLSRLEQLRLEQSQQAKNQTQ